MAPLYPRLKIRLSAAQKTRIFTLFKQIDGSIFRQFNPKYK